MISWKKLEYCLKNSAQGQKRGQNHRDGLRLSGDDEPKSKSKSQDSAKAHPLRSHSLGEEPSTTKKFRHDTSSFSTVSTFCLTSQSIPAFTQG